MRNATVLTVIAFAGLVNGLWLDEPPAWRQLLFVVLAVTAYLQGRYLPVRHGGLVPAVAAAAGVVIAVLEFWEGVSALVCLGLFVVLPRLVGLFRRQQAELVEAGRQRIVQLEQAQELVAERARLRERARIAADMHDSVGHELALIALRAGALELTADTEQNREAAAGLRESAVMATDRLRQTIGVLRDGGAAPVEPPDEAVEALVERAATAGLPVTLIRAGPAAPLPALVDRAVHRVVQEGLTNATRHAPGAPVSVRVERTADEVVVTVSNPIDPGPSGDDTETAGGTGTGTGSSGSGLAGLAERVRLSGGTLRSGPGGGRFTVVACLPTGHHEGGGE